MNTELNPKLFNEDNFLKPEIRERLIEITNEFLRPISKNIVFKVYDIRLVGSNAGYNYTDTSDVDLHLVVDLTEICRDCPEIVQFLFNAEKSKFNLLYDIEVKGIQVEIYVEDIRAGTHSNGIYSVLENDWIKKPEQTDIDYELLYDEIRDSTEYQKEVNQIVALVNTGDSEEIEEKLSELYLNRKSALDSEGELGAGNILFKTLRADGYLDKLRSAYYDKRSNELTLESLMSSLNSKTDDEIYNELVESGFEFEDIENGDLVNFGSYGDLYVVDKDYSDNYYWVTDDKYDRGNPKAFGNTMPKYLAVEIVDRYNNSDDDDDWD